MIRFPFGRVAFAGVLVCGLAAAAGAQDGISPQTQRINELVAKGWADAGIKKPAAKSTDHEFLRRVFIDLVGRIATPEEVIDFENDKSPNKRVKLVNRLLTAEKYQPKKGGQPVSVTVTGADGKQKTIPLAFDYANEWSEHWANIWTVWLMTRTGHPLYREQMRTWLEIQFSKNVSHKDLAVALITATGKTNENGAVNFVVHHLGEPVRDDPMTTVNERSRDGAFDAVPVTSRITKLFLGLQTQCTQCHDHPFNKEWVQADFWGVNAFFRQTVRSATPSMAPLNRNKMDNPVQITLSDDTNLNSDLIVYYERRDGRRIGSFPVMLKDVAQADRGENSAKRLAAAPQGKTRREQLAAWVVGHDNFSKAYANRVWGHFFGRGLNKEPAVDDFGGHNEIIHPELLEYLGQEFAKYNHDPKKLMEWICTSDAYGLSHVATKDTADPKFDPFFARMPLKAMSPEVLFESLMVATKAESRANAEQRKAQRDSWMRKLVQNFGDDEGNELNFNGTVVQALLMMNGSELNSEISGTMAKGPKGPTPNSVVAEVVRKHGSPSGVYDELFMMTLNRHPTADEVKKLDDVRKNGASVALGPPVKPVTPPPKSVTPPPKSAPGATGPADVAFYQDVFWALLNTSEFMLNH